jgi:hypothetical protein
MRLTNTSLHICQLSCQLSCQLLSAELFVPFLRGEDPSQPLRLTFLKASFRASGAVREIAFINEAQLRYSTFQHMTGLLNCSTGEMCTCPEPSNYTH